MKYRGLPGGMRLPACIPQTLKKCLVCGARWARLRKRACARWRPAGLTLSDPGNPNLKRVS